MMGRPVSQKLFSKALTVTKKTLCCHLHTLVTQPNAQRYILIARGVETVGVGAPPQQLAAAYFREGLLLRENTLPELPQPEKIVANPRLLTRG